MGNAIAPRTDTTPSEANGTDTKSDRLLQLGGLFHAGYAKASQLKLSTKEQETLSEPFTDEEVEILPTGELYVPHILIRKRLAKAIGIGQWSMIEREHKMDTNARQIYANFIMLVRGHYVGETWCGCEFFPSNPQSNMADALEGLEGIAVRRIAGKKLNCGSQVWEPAYCRSWIEKYGEKYVTTNRRGERVDRWKRKAKINVVSGDAFPTDADNTDAPRPTPPEPSQAEPAWLTEYADSIDAAQTADDILAAETQAKQYFGNCNAAEKAQVKKRLETLKKIKDAKLASFASAGDREKCRELIDVLAEQFGQERFLDACNAAGLRGDSDSWSLAKLQEVQKTLNAEPW